MSGRGKGRRAKRPGADQRSSAPKHPRQQQEGTEVPQPMGAPLVAAGFGKQDVMKAVRISAFGGPKVFQCETDVPVPTPSDSQVLIKVSAAGINPIDWIKAGGHFPVSPPLPYTPGCDAAGTVVDIGKNVTKFKKGDRVYCMCSASGSFAEYATAEETKTGFLGDKLTFAQGAAIGIPYYVAYRAAVQKANLRSGETVLIHGASGGCGLACVQLCKRLGANVLGTAGSDAGMEVVKQHGASLVFNHKLNGYEHQIKDHFKDGVDVIIEMAATTNLQKDLELLAKRGRIVVVGVDGKTNIDPFLMLFKDVSMFGISILDCALEEYSEVTSFVETGIESGWVDPVVGKEYPLTSADQAITETMKKTAALGKVVLTV